MLATPKTIHRTAPQESKRRCIAATLTGRSRMQDPEAKKPEEWDDRAMIPDPEDTKPDDWDDTPKTVADKDATKPEDWDDDDDGAWEAPQVPNPEYKGEWSAKYIDNPEYKVCWWRARPSVLVVDILLLPWRMLWLCAGLVAPCVWRRCFSRSLPSSRDGSADRMPQRFGIRGLSPRNCDGCTAAAFGSALAPARQRVALVW